MELANEKLRERIAKLMQEGIANEATPAEYKAIFQEWLDNALDADKTKDIYERIVPMLEAAKDKCPVCAGIYDLKQYIVKRSRAASGSSAATVLLTTSATAASTT